MRDGHASRINVGMHCIKLFNYILQLVHSAPYREGSNTKEFKEGEIDKMIGQKVLEPVQTE